MASMAEENGGRQIGSRIGAGVAIASDALETANTPSKLTARRDGAGDRDEHTHLLHRPRYAPSTPIPSADRDQKPRLTARRMTTAGVTAAESTGSVANLLAKDGEQDDTEGASMVQTVQSDDEFAALMGCGSHGDENGSNAASSHDGEEPVVVVDFTASWSLPCRQIAPFFEGIAQRYATTGRARFVKVSMYLGPTTAGEFLLLWMPRVSLLPSQLALRLFHYRWTSTSCPLQPRSATCPPCRPFKSFIVASSWERLAARASPPSRRWCGATVFSSHQRKQGEKNAAERQHKLMWVLTSRLNMTLYCRKVHHLEPPSTDRHAPETQLAISDAKNSAALAMSSGCPGRWMKLPSIRLACFSGLIACHCFSLAGLERMKPGAIQLTLIPAGPSSSASCFVSPICACFAAV